MPLPAFVTPDVLGQEQIRLLSLTNNLRAQKGVSQLDESQLLQVSASLKAQDMSTNQYFSHVSPDGRTLKDYLKEAGYSYKTAGENLAMGFNTAEDIFAAWMKSSSHLNNLIDPDFSEHNLALSSGLYSDIPTVFVAYHFGTEESVSAQGPSTHAVSPEAVETPKQEPTQDNIPGDTTTQVVSEIPLTPSPYPGSTSVEGLKESSEVATTQVATLGISADEDITYESKQSSMAWKRTTDGMKLDARVSIVGRVASATIETNGYTIELAAVPSEKNVFTGSLSIVETPESFFEVILSPTLTVVSEDGNTHTFMQEWDNPLVVSPSPLLKYTRARTKLPIVIKYFNVYEIGFLALFLFFSIALFVNLVYEIHKQHIHVVRDTALLLGLLVIMILI